MIDMSRILDRKYSAFGLGVLVGLLVGVALLGIGALRRTSRGQVKRAPPIPFIDGVHPPSEVTLDLQPQVEASTTQRLESEASDPFPVDERW
jgi:hypothetical protein